MRTPSVLVAWRRCWHLRQGRRAGLGCAPNVGATQLGTSRAARQPALALRSTTARQPAPAWCSATARQPALAPCSAAMRQRAPGVISGKRQAQAAASQQGSPPTAATCAALRLQERERLDLADFAALEHVILCEAERGAAGEAAQWRSDAGAAAAQLAEARQRLVDTDAALLQRDEEVGAHACEAGCRAGSVASVGSRAAAPGVPLQRTTPLLHHRSCTLRPLPAARRHRCPLHPFCRAGAPAAR